MPIDPDVLVENELEKLKKEGEKILEQVSLRSFISPSSGLLGMLEKSS